jgi:hypothetical protein
MEHNLHRRCSHVAPSASDRTLWFLKEVHQIVVMLILCKSETCCLAKEDLTRVATSSQVVEIERQIQNRDCVSARRALQILEYSDLKAPLKSTFRK